MENEEIFLDRNEINNDVVEFAIPDGVTNIDVHVFYRCHHLRSVTIPESVTRIGFSAFEDCPKLTIHTPKGSYAESWAKENGVPVVND